MHAGVIVMLATGDRKLLCSPGACLGSVSARASVMHAEVTRRLFCWEADRKLLRGAGPGHNPAGLVAAPQP